MARPKQYNPDTALKSVMETFWQKGFDATSMTDLVDATGLKPGSLYGAFGNKRTFYRKTLEAYAEQMVAQLDDVLTQERPALETLKRFYAFFLNFCIDTPQGCFMVNALFDADIDDQKQLTHIQGLFAQVEQRLKTFFEKAVAEKVPLVSDDPDMLAKIVMTHIYGLRGFAKYRPDQLAKLPEQLLAMLMCVPISHPSPQETIEPRAD